MQYQKCLWSVSAGFPHSSVIYASYIFWLYLIYYKKYTFSEIIRIIIYISEIIISDYILYLIQTLLSPTAPFRTEPSPGPWSHSSPPSRSGTFFINSTPKDLIIGTFQGKILFDVTAGVNI